MSVLNHEPSHALTRDRLLESAGEIFAEQGFHSATVRDICERAQANVAAINYHFGDKEKLYSQVLKYGAQKVLERFPPDRGLGENATPEEQLQAFVNSFISRFLDSSGPDWHARLCAREMIEPTEALDELVSDIIRPLSERLHAIVRSLVGSSLNEDRIRLCALSIIGQMLFYHHNRPVIERLYGKQLYVNREVERVTRHITEFSIQAIRHIAKSKAQEK
jgi:TetR/AcrR family transcriptional regulator, regulator of cefoperazone and chloramphenicol sensitivity